MTKVLRLLKISETAMRWIAKVGWPLYCVSLIVLGGYVLVMGLAPWQAFAGYAIFFYILIMLLVSVILSIHDGGPALRRRIDQMETDLAYLETHAVIRNGKKGQQ